MQDRYRQLDEILLRRTAGPYIRVNSFRLKMSVARPLYSPIPDMMTGRLDFGFGPEANVTALCSDISRADKCLPIIPRRSR